MGPLDPAVVSLAERLIADRWPGAGLVALRMLPGHSGLTVRVDIDGDPGIAVIKLCPPGRAPVGRHDILRQAVLVSELAQRGDVPVPEVLHLSDIDSPAAIFAWVAGEAIEPILDPEAGPLSAEIVAGRFHSCARALANLHSIRPTELKTAAGEKIWTPSDELERWQPVMSTTDKGLRRGADDLARALESSWPAPVEPALIHGDYRLGNVLCSGVDVAAIIDWEIWSIGDPRVDLAWYLIMTTPGDLPGAATPVSGVPAPADVVAAYEAAAGHPMTDLPWFNALSRYKMAATMGNNLQRHRTGRRLDPYQERLVDTIPALIEAGLNLLDS